MACGLPNRRLVLATILEKEASCAIKTNFKKWQLRCTETAHPLVVLGFNHEANIAISSLGAVRHLKS